MKILLTNDDGIDAPGLNALAEVLSARHEVSVVAPTSQRSGNAHAVTFHDPIVYTKLKSDVIENYYSVGGTPADCVKLAALLLFKDRLPDLVIAGINDSSNLGCDTIYSGTVSAALEAAYMGLRGISVSLYGGAEKGGAKAFRRAARFIDKNLEDFVNISLNRHSILNINHPAGEASGVIATKLGYNQYSDRYAILDKSAPNRVQLVGSPLGHDDDDTDVAWAMKNYITLTPITLDRNDYDALKLIRGKDFG